MLFAFNLIEPLSQQITKKFPGSGSSSSDSDCDGDIKSAAAAVKSKIYRLFHFLMQEPFCSVPLIWIIQEDSLANRLQLYQTRGWDNLLSNWKNAFSRANAVVFPEFSFPMLYSMLDTGNYFVIPGSPIEFWAAERYSKTHSKFQLRKESGFDNDDLLVVIPGSSFFYYELAWDYALALHDLGHLLLK
ncbi:hypothetical protein OROMI_011114 [Orobanche minor]